MSKRECPWMFHECPTCKRSHGEDIARAVAEEREACAQLFDAEAEEGLADMTFREWCEWMAARLRARGEKT